MWMIDLYVSGSRQPQVSALDKSSGNALFTDDGMIHPWWLERMGSII